MKTRSRTKGKNLSNQTTQQQNQQKKILSNIYRYEKETTQTAFFPSHSPGGEKNDHQWQLAVAESNTKSRLHAQERMLRLLLVVSGALHSQRNFSSNEL
ncbi:hypothetical protein I79_012055 [Cricetulus griseus]|uniref:Uncharacterized protein n=1 Tax=Cricetulus griseus TaxID=10029 RepID=G3HMT2_CRIGR|nr:hypothetical protein I79_012055 [Cricetulus griseus]